MTSETTVRRQMMTPESVKLVIVVAPVIGSEKPENAADPAPLAPVNRPVPPVMVYPPLKVNVPGRNETVTRPLRATTSCSPVAVSVSVMGPETSPVAASAPTGVKLLIVMVPVKVPAAIGVPLVITPLRICWQLVVLGSQFSETGVTMPVPASFRVALCPPARQSPF